jgi:hypothetical protein
VHAMDKHEKKINNLKNIKKKGPMEIIGPIVVL